MVAEQTWLVIPDRYGDESRAKSGRVSSLEDACEALINEYERQLVKPKIEVLDVGIGTAIANLLEDRGIPVVRKAGLLHRNPAADVFKYKEFVSD